MTTPVPSRAGLGARTSSDGHHDHVGLDPVATVDGDRRRTLLRGVTSDLHASLDIDAAFLERTVDHTRHLGVATDQDRGQRFKNGHLASHVREQRRELTANGAATDDRGARG